MRPSCQSEARELRELWRTARMMGWRLRRRGFSRWLAPLDYTRCREIPGLLTLLGGGLSEAGGAVLDIASPQILSVHLALRHPSCRFVYLNPFGPERAEMQRQVAAAGVANVEVVDGDARDTGRFAPESFGAVLSCSVLEHVGDLNGCRGDALCAANAVRWLAPGGRFLFSVPFYSSGFDEYRDAPVYAEAVNGSGPCFFQRFYDPDSLAERLLLPMEAPVESQCYYGERWYYERDIHRRFAHLLTSRWARVALGRLFPVLASVFLERADDHRALRKPYLALVAVRKP